jgi:hypothetical protein
MWSIWLLLEVGVVVGGAVVAVRVVCLLVFLV